VPGANDCLTVEDIKKIEPLIKSTSVLMCQLEVPLSTTLEALKLGRQHGGIVCVFIAYYIPPFSHYNPKCCTCNILT